MHQLLLSRKVESFLAKVQKSDDRLFNQFIKGLDKIAENPYSGKSLVGNLKGYYSYRVRNYRILFEIEEKESLVYIEKIESRKEVYR